MKVRIRPSVRVDGYVVSDDLTLTKDWTTVVKKIGKELLELTYNGQALVESDEVEADEAETEEVTEVFEDSGTE